MGMGHMKVDIMVVAQNHVVLTVAGLMTTVQIHWATIFLAQIVMELKIAELKVAAIKLVELKLVGLEVRLVLPVARVVDLNQIHALFAINLAVTIAVAQKLLGKNQMARIALLALIQLILVVQKLVVLKVAELIRVAIIVTQHMPMGHMAVEAIAAGQKIAELIVI